MVSIATVSTSHWINPSVAAESRPSTGGGQGAFEADAGVSATASLAAPTSALASFVALHGVHPAAGGQIAPSAEAGSLAAAAGAAAASAAGTVGKGTPGPGLEPGLIKGESCVGSHRDPVSIR